MKNRLFSYVMVLFLVGMVWASYRAAASSEHAAESEAVEALGKAFQLAEQYADGDLKAEDLVYGAIEGMLGTLDPHTHFLEPDEFRYMNQEHAGKFYGIGIVFDMIDGWLTIVSPIDGTPAHKAGLRAGDRIVKVEGKSMKGVSTNEVISTLRGEKGAPVTITIRREGVSDWDVTIVRSEIPLISVRYAFMLTPEIGYVRISSFAQKTAAELVERMQNLEKEGMRKLVLDLRGNPGGLLDTAVKISTAFLDPDLLVVYTKGRVADSNNMFYTHKAKYKFDGPIIVMVNEGSASASEIVAGAIQDHDRGLVIGKTSFGKGLVESLIPLSGRDGGALQITTAKFYTPSGRSIQRPYRTGYGFKDLNYFIDRAGRTEANSEEISKGNQPGYYTLNGKRTVLGGGGITPDVEIPDAVLPLDIAAIRNKGLFFFFAVQYTNRVKEIPSDFETTDAILREFLDYLKENNEALQEPLNEERTKLAKNSVKAEILSIRDGYDAKYRVWIEEDSQIQKALEHFDEAERIYRTIYLPAMLEKQSENKRDA